MKTPAATRCLNLKGLWVSFLSHSPKPLTLLLEDLVLNTYIHLLPRKVTLHCTKLAHLCTPHRILLVTLSILLRDEYNGWETTCQQGSARTHGQPRSSSCRADHVCSCLELLFWAPKGPGAGGRIHSTQMSGSLITTSQFSRSS